MNHIQQYLLIQVTPYLNLHEINHSFHFNTYWNRLYYVTPKLLTNQFELIVNILEGSARISKRDTYGYEFEKKEFQSKMKQGLVSLCTHLSIMNHVNPMSSFHYDCNEILYMLQHYKQISKCDLHINPFVEFQNYKTIIELLNQKMSHHVHLTVHLHYSNVVLKSESPILSVIERVQTLYLKDMMNQNNIHYVDCSHITKVVIYTTPNFLSKYFSIFDVLKHQLLSLDIWIKRGYVKEQNSAIFQQLPSYIQSMQSLEILWIQFPLDCNPDFVSLLPKLPTSVHTLSYIIFTYGPNLSEHIIQEAKIEYIPNSSIQTLTIYIFQQLYVNFKWFQLTFPNIKHLYIQQRDIVDRYMSNYYWTFQIITKCFPSIQTLQYPCHISIPNAPLPIREYGVLLRKIVVDEKTNFA